MFWLIFRTTLYIALFALIWHGGQFYVQKELISDLQKFSPHVIFVDEKILENETASKMQSGSFTYPFSHIETALLAATERNISTIIIAPGTYNELLTLPDNITLYGSGNDVIISQEIVPQINTLTTGNNIKLINLTISGGNNAVLIPYNTSVTFLNTIMSHAGDFGVKMEKKKRPKTLPGEKADVVYEIFYKTDDEIANMPLVRFSNVTITKNDNQGMYLRDGRVEIINSKVIENGEEGIDLHPHMHTTIINTIASRNGESGLETEIYDNVVTIENSTFNNNTKNGVAFLTSMGIGDITLINNIVTNNAKFGMRCAVHKNRPKKPRPFFQSVISWKDGNNIFENNFKRNIASECYTF